MKLTPALLLLATILFYSCGNKDKKGSSSSGEVFTADTTHKPYQYAELIYTEEGIALKGKHAANIAVGILGSMDDKVFTCKTTSGAKKIEDEMGESYEITPLDKKFQPDSSFGEAIAVLNYSGQQYSRIKTDTIREVSLIDSLKKLVINSGALKKLYTDTRETRKFDTYASRLFERAKQKTPKVVELKIPGLSVYLVSYVLDEKYDPDNDSSPTLIVINGKAYTASGPCGKVLSVYKFGNNYFLNADWFYCFEDVGSQEILEIRSNGLKDEASFDLTM